MPISRVLLSSPPTRSLASCILRCLLRNSIGFLPGNRRLRKYLPIVSERFKAFLARSSSCRNKRRRRCFNNWGRLDKTFPRVFKKCNSCFQTFTAFPDCSRPALSKTFLGFGFFFEVNQTFTIVSNPCLPNKAPGGGGGLLHMMACTGRLLPGRGTFFMLQVYEREGISLVEVYKREGRSVIWVCKRAQRTNR